MAQHDDESVSPASLSPTERKSQFCLESLASLPDTSVEAVRSYLDTLTGAEDDNRNMLCFAWDMSAVLGFYHQALLRAQQPGGLPPPAISLVNLQAFILSITNLIATNTDAAGEGGAGPRVRFGSFGFATKDEGDFGAAVSAANTFDQSEWVRTTRQVPIQHHPIGGPLAILHIHEKSRNTCSLRAYYPNVMQGSIWAAAP